MKKGYLLSGALFGAAFLAMQAMPVKACTEIYVGKDLSTTGQTIYGRTEDGGKNNLKLYDVKQAGAIKAGSSFTDAEGWTYTWGNQDSYRYTSVRDAKELWDGSSQTCYEAQGTNQYGVSISATESLYENEKTDAADPYADSKTVGEHGIGEQSFTTIVLGQAKTAREGIDIILDAVDKSKCSEPSGILVGDANETWYLEIVSGTQYAAYKLPNDICYVNPNVTIMKNVNTEGATNRAATTKTDFVVSPNLINIAKTAGTYTDINGKIGDAADGKTIDLNLSYSDQNSSTRMKSAMDFLNPSLGVTTNNSTFKFAFKPNRKLSMEDVFNFFKLDYIERQATMECTIFQRFDNVPTDLSVVEWRAMVAPKYSVFIPSYPMLINKTPDAYKLETAFTDNYTYDAKSAYFAFQGVKEKCYADKDVFGKNAIANYANIQNYITNQFAIDQNAIVAKYASNPATSKEYATTLLQNYTDVAMNAANALYDGKEVTVPAVKGSVLPEITVPSGSNVKVNGKTEITDPKVVASATKFLSTLAADLKKAGFDVLSDTFKIFDLNATGSGKVTMAVGKDYAGKIALVGHFHDGAWTVQQCLVDADGNIAPEFNSFSPVFVELTTANKPVTLSVAAEPAVATPAAATPAKVASPKTGVMDYTFIILVLCMAVATTGLVVIKRKKSAK